MLRPGELSLMEKLPANGCTPKAAEEYTRWLATHHYENFNVVSWLLPKELHQHFYNVYAYCRWADDLGDEVPAKERALELLASWEQELDACYEGRPSHPVFVALRETTVAKDVPKQPLADLLKAFRQDQVVKRYPTWEAVLDYCLYSANPVGRLVLYLCGYSDPARQKLSDATCTALQLANFWQDVTVDQLKDRVYLPLDLLEGPLAVGRVTVVGEARRAAPADIAGARAAYLARHPNAVHWVDFGDFAFWSLDVRAVYFVGGFGAMGWVSGAEYMAAAPDPL